MKFVKCFCVCLTDPFAIVFDGLAKTSESRTTFCRSFFLYFSCVFDVLSVPHTGNSAFFWTFAELRCVVHKVQL